MKNLVAGGNFDFSAYFSRVSAPNFSISALSVLKLAKCSVSFRVLVFGLGKAGSTSDTMIGSNKLFRPLVSLLALMLIREMCLSSSDLCSVFSMLKISHSSLWYR